MPVKTTVLDHLIEWALDNPRQLLSAGYILTVAGCLLFVIGAWGQLATTATGAILRLGSPAAADKTLSELYPSLPTWLVPESIYGFLMVVAMVGIGIALGLTGKQIVRITGMNE